MCIYDTDMIVIMLHNEKCYCTLLAINYCPKKWMYTYYNSINFILK